MDQELLNDFHNHWCLCDEKVTQLETEQKRLSSNQILQKY